MGAGNTEGFLQQLAEDKGLQEKLQAIQAVTRKGMVEEVARIASEAGFPMTEATVESFLRDEDQLGDSDLDAISGGIQVDPGIQPSHTYTILGTYTADGQTYVTLRNPWGTP